METTSGRVLIAIIMVMISLPASSASSDWYDENVSDNAVWTNRIQLNFTDVSTAGCKFPVTIKLGQLFGEEFNYSTINLDSIRVVEPDAEGGGGSIGGEALKHQLDYVNLTPEAAAENKNGEISFIIDVPALTTNAYYIYYSDGKNIRPLKAITDLNYSIQGSIVTVENNKAEFGGFKNGYFGLYNYLDKVYGSNIVNPELGLDYGFSVESSTDKEDFPKYDRYWECFKLNGGPVRFQVKCNASSLNYTLEKVFTFYSGLPYYVSRNTLESLNPAKMQVRWNIYSVLKPYFTKGDSSLYIEHTSGVEEGKSCYMMARYVRNGEPRNNFFMIAGRGDVDCLFLEDRLGDYDLFSVVLNAHGKKIVTGETLYLFSVGGFDTAREEYLRFKSPPELKTSKPETNRMTIVSPSSGVFYDILFNETAIIPIEATNLHGSSSVSCSMMNAYGEVIHSNVRLYNDGSHGDAKEGDNTWTNGDVHVITNRDSTGLWNVNCTEEGSQSIKTTASGKFAMTYNYNYRKITFCDEREKEVKIRPGETLNVGFCVENVGGINESNVSLGILDLPYDWRAYSDVVERHPRGERSTIALRLTIPVNQSLVYRTLWLNTMSDGVMRGIGVLKVEVVVPVLYARIESYENAFGIRAVNERGEEVEKADVLVVYPSGNTVNGLTTVNGRFVLPYVEAGVVEITVSREGYAPTEVKLDIKETAKSGMYAYMTIILFCIVAAIFYLRAVKGNKRAG